MKELLIAANSDPDSSLAYLLRVPLGDGIVFRTAGTWPRNKALYCYPAEDWPADPVIVERVPLRSCVRRGAAIDVVAARARENRSQLVFTTARGPDAVFWQSPRTRKQARPSVALPSARAAGIAELEIVVDSHERYGYRFAGQQVRTTSRALPCGDYGIRIDGTLMAAVERKSLPDLTSSLTSGRLRYALGRTRCPATRRGGGRGPLLLDLQARPGPPRADRRRAGRMPGPLAQHPDRLLRNPRPRRGMDYRYLAAAHTWATAEPAAIERIEPPSAQPFPANKPGRQPADIRTWARHNGIDIPDRGPIPASVRQAWERSSAVHTPDITPTDVLG